MFLRFQYVVAPRILYPFVFSATLSRQWFLHKLAKTSGLQNPGHLVHIQTSVVRISRSLSKFSRKKYRKQMGHALRSSYTMRTKCAISDAFVRDCVFAYCASVAQYVYSLSAEHCFRLRNNTISDERVRDCAVSTHSVFRPLLIGPWRLDGWQYRHQTWGTW